MSDDDLIRDLQMDCIWTLSKFHEQFPEEHLSQHYFKSWFRPAMALLEYDSCSSSADHELKIETEDFFPDFNEAVCILCNGLHNFHGQSSSVFNVLEGKKYLNINLTTLLSSFRFFFLVHISNYEQCYGEITQVYKQICCGFCIQQMVSTSWCDNRFNDEEFSRS